MKSITNKLKEYGQHLVDDLTGELDDRRINASYNLSQSIGFRVTPSNKSIVMEVFLDDYGVWINKGRKPGSMPPVSEIYRWATTKERAQVVIRSIANRRKISMIKATQSYAWGVAKNIEKYGTEPKPFIDEVLKRNRGNAIIKEIEDDFIIEIEKIIDGSNL